MQYNEEWKQSTMPCFSCGSLVVGYKNDKGDLKYQCPKCKTAMVRKTKGRRHFTVECYAAKEAVGASHTVN
jgi:predicted RNA-binding Zn-ribbon protein involved in translation (DUF1610 family)